MSKITASLAFLVALIAVVGCEDPVAPPPAAIAASAGNNQTGAAGTQLPTVLTVTVTDANGRPVRNQPVTWSVTTGGGSIIRIDSITDGTGVARARWVLGNTAGPNAATAAVPGIAPVVFTATGTAGAAAMIVFNRDSLAARNVGDTVRITARVTDAFGNSVPDQSVTWVSSNEAVATVSSTGLITIRGRGTATVTATRGTVTGNFRVNVVQIARVIITPSPVSLTALNDSIRVTARVEDAQGVPFTNVAVIWTISNTNIATITNTGLVRSVARGTTQIQARADGVLATAPVNVTQAIASVAITPQNPAVGLGTTTQLTASAVDARGSPVPGLVFQWITANPAIATVTQTGVVTGVQRDTVRITARSGSFVASTLLAVTFLLSSISAGESHSCAVGAIAPGRTQAGICWGLGLQGRLGAGNTESSNSPVAVAIALNFSRIVAGGAHSCGIAADGNVYCWGYNGLGQLGNATMAESTSPAFVAGSAGFNSITAGLSHNCALGPGGQVLCWGSHQYGQLGTGPATEACGIVPCRRAPTAVASSQTFTSISAGARHSCAITANNQLFCWGDNSHGQLGTNSFTPSNVPVAVDVSTQFSQVTAGEDFSCALSVDGVAFCWGRNDLGQLGNGNTASVTGPIQVQTSVTFIQLVAGAQHACGRTGTGAIYCWGNNNFGQLGNGTTTNSSVPVQVSGGVAFNSMAAGREHTCGVSTSAAGYCWGQNLYGQLGTGNNVSVFQPTRVQ